MRRNLRRAMIAIGLLVAVLAANSLLPWRPYPAAADREFRPGSRLLFVMAHHDDELVRIVRIRRLQRLGHEVHAVWLARDHHRTSLGVGRAESRCAMRLAGVPPGHFHFPPNDLISEPGTYLEQLPLLTEYLTSLLRELRPAGVFVNAFEGGHIEHDAAHVAAVLAVARGGQSTGVYEFPFYNAGGSRWPYYQVMTLIERPGASYSDYPSLSELALLARGAACFQSQSAHLWGALAGAHFRLFSRGLPFRTVSDYDYDARPHPGRLNYEGLEWYRTLTRAFPAVGDTFVSPDGSTFSAFVEAYRIASAPPIEPTRSPRRDPGN